MLNKYCRYPNVGIIRNVAHTERYGLNKILCMTSPHVRPPTRVSYHEISGSRFRILWEIIRATRGFQRKKTIVKSYIHFVLLNSDWSSIVKLIPNCTPSSKVYQSIFLENGAWEQPNMANWKVLTTKIGLEDTNWICDSVENWQHFSPTK